MLHKTTSDQGHLRQYTKTSPRAIRPFRISWQGKDYVLSNITDYYITNEDGVDVHVFSANDGTDTFQLRLTSEEMTWFLGL